MNPTHCFNCTVICNIGGIGNAIMVDFPYGHPLDSTEDFLFFCSSECLIKYIEREQINKKGGE